MISKDEANLNARSLRLSAQRTFKVPTLYEGASIY
jgi:hypothetical protein